MTMDTKREAEQAWDEFDIKMDLDYWTIDISRKSREAFKEALREAIEKHKAELNKFRNSTEYSEVWVAYENRLRELSVFEDLLETVKPKI